jgi:hypothetical protein
MRIRHKKFKANKSRGLAAIQFSIWMSEVKKIALMRQVGGWENLAKWRDLYEQDLTPMEAVNKVDPKTKVIRKKVDDF